MNTRNRAVGPPFVVLLALLPALAARRSEAQQESAAAAMGEGEAPSASASVVVEGGPQAPSPHWTQTRSFAATRFWLLDPGRQSVEAWYGLRTCKDGSCRQPNQSTVTQHLWQIEYMVSPFRGFQLDVYFNYIKEPGGVDPDAHVEGMQIEGRFTPFRYGEVFLNPTLYLEWHPQTRGPNRAEARLLFGGEITRRLRGATNLFFEQNVDSPDGVKANFVADREVGFTAALSYAVIDRVLSLGAETRILEDQQGDRETYQNVAKLGPAVWLSDETGSVFVVGSFLCGLTDHSDKFNTIVVVGLVR